MRWIRQQNHIRILGDTRFRRRTLIAKNLPLSVCEREEFKTIDACAEVKPQRRTTMSSLSSIITDSRMPT
jgi:hypothetical protein